MTKKVTGRKGRYYVKNNNENLRLAFYKKQLFNNLAVKQPRHVVDFTYAEKFLYGRVDNFNVPIRLNSKGRSTLATIPNTNIMAQDFVVDAFNQMIVAFKRDTLSGKIPHDPIINFNMVPVKGYEDPNVLYEEYFETFTKVVVKKFSEKQILNFGQFMLLLEQLLQTGEGIRSMPFTKSAFVKSRLCPINASSLVLEFGDYKHSNDIQKVDMFFNNPLWNYFMQACNNYGFMIDARAPWRIIADIESEGMRRAAQFAGNKYPRPSSRLFVARYERVFAQEFANFSANMLRLYNAVRETSYVVPAYCPERKKTIPQRFISKEYTIDSLKKEFDEKYFLKFYLKIRINEEESERSDKEKQEFADSVFHYIDAYGITRALKAFESILNKTFDYNGSMSYYFKKQALMDKNLEESQSGDTNQSMMSQAGTGGTAGGGGY
tara:strand:+ start:4197 stop:5501 length:1305 start_codon:yes stop_codon:yes gene_type:complete